MSKRIISAIAALLLVLVPVAARATIGTTAGSGSICPGTEADIPVSVSGCNGVSAISLALGYDASKVTYLGYQNASAHFGSNLHVNATGGVVYLTWFSLNAVDFGDENLIEFRFEGISGTTSLAWNSANCEYSDANGNVIASTYTNGSITVYALPAISSQPNSVTLIEGQNATFAVTATGSGLSYQWQVSADGQNWNNLSNGTPYSNVTTRQMNIASTPLSFDGNHYRCKVSGYCEPDVYSNAATLTVLDNLPTINTTAGSATTCPETEFSIPVSVTNCNNVGAISLALTYNTNLVTYIGYENPNANLSNGMMQLHEDNGTVYFTWVATSTPLSIGGAILFELKFESQSGNSNFTWNTAECEYSTPTGRIFPKSFTSGSATVHYVPTITSHPGNRTINEGTNTTFSISASGTGLAYRWQVSADGGDSWSNVSNGTYYNNVTSATLTVRNVTTGMDGYQYRCKVTGTCDPEVYSNAGLLHVNPLLPTITTQIVNTSSCQDVEFEADVAVNNFNNVGSVSLALNYNTSLLTFEGYDNLNDALEDGSLFVNATEGTIYISWMSVTGANIGNGILLSLKFTGSPGSNTLSWNTSRCEYANTQGMVFPATYQNGTVTVYAAPYINSHPSNRTVNEGSSTSFSVTAGGQALTYQWQVSSNEGETWTNLSYGGHYSNVTSSTLHVNNAALDMNGLWYRCEVNGQCEPGTVSNTASLTVNHILPTVTTRAGTLTTCSDTEFSIPVTVTNFNQVGAVSLALAYNANVLTYEGFEGVNGHLSNGDLHVNADGGVVYITWMSVNGTSIGNGTLLWIKFIGEVGSTSLSWNTGDCEYSDPLGQIFPATYTNGSVTVSQVNFTIDTHPESQAIVAGDTTIFAVTTTGSSLSYQWQVSEDEGVSWDDLSANAFYVNVNTRTLQVNGATLNMNGNLYRCSVSGSCGMQYSHSALLTVGSLEDFYDVTVTVTPENAGSATGAGTYYEGDTVTMMATPNTGYHFVHWTENDSVVSAATPYVFYIHENHGFVANFALNQYDITVSSNIGSAGDLEGAGPYLYGETCTLTAIAHEGYTFVRWMLNGTQVTTNPSFSFTVTESRNYVAYFVQNQYEIMATTLPEEGGTVTGAGTYTHGTTCTLTATPNPGYYFINWTQGGIEVSTEPSYSFVVTEAAVYVAHFGQNAVYYTISVTSNPIEGGVVTGAGSYVQGTTCTLTATANTGYHFINWTQGGLEVSTELSFSFEVTGDAAYVANFAINSYDITVTTNPTEGGTVTGAGTYNYAETCTLTATANEGYAFVNWTRDGIEISTETTYNFTVTEAATFVANFLETTTDITQTTAFAEGWNWWSTYVDQTGIDGLTMLEEGLGDNGVTVKSQGDGFVQYMNYGGYAFWYGTLDHIANSQTYMVQTTASVQVEMTGAPVSPADCPITISEGWNWIGFPSADAMDFETAFSGITPSNNDIVKSQNSFAQYMEYGGYGFWYGGLNSSTITPGTGLMYKSENSESFTFTYPAVGRTAETAETTIDKHWTNNVHLYPANMTVLAVVELNDIELRSDSYELAAFANGECRGSAKLMYVEPLNRYMAFLTVSGNEAAELHFGLYDGETGEENYTSNDMLVYVTDATVGSYDEPMVVSFRSTTGLDDIDRDLQVYPNPVKRGERFSINLPVGSEVRVDVVNALGAIVSTETSTKALTNLLAPNTAGVYTLRITVEGEGTYCRKLVVR